MRFLVFTIVWGHILTVMWPFIRFLKKIVVCGHTVCDVVECHIFFFSVFSRVSGYTH